MVCIVYYTKQRRGKACIIVAKTRIMSLPNKFHRHNNGPLDTNLW